MTPAPGADPATGGPSARISVGVVLVTHDTRDDVLASLASLADAGADEVVVVDSGSTDGTSAAVRDRHPEVECLTLPNVGFGRAANAGVATTTADVVVVANADTQFTPGAAAGLGRFMAANPRVGAAGPKVVFPDGRLQLSARSFPDIGTAIGHALFGIVWPSNPWTREYRLTDWDHDSERDVDWLSGCCVALRRTAFDEVEGFDPAYFMFVEDVDLCWRLGEAGWRVTFTPSAQVVHAVGASVSRRRVRMVVEHARSLDRFFGRRYKPGALGRLLIRGGLLAWALSVITWQAARGKTHGQSA